MYLVEALRDKPVPIEDIGMIIHPGVEYWLEDKDYQRSLCLQRLVRMGWVRATPGENSRMTKKPARRAKARVAELSRPRTGKDVKAKVRAPAPLPTPPQAPNPDLITRAEAGEIASRAAREAVEAVLGLLPARTPAEDPDLEERVERAVNRALDARPAPVVNVVGGQAQVTAVGPTDDEHVYIPSGIVSEEANPDLEISSEASSEEGVGDAAAALKALRKKEKK